MGTTPGISLVNPAEPGGAVDRSADFPGPGARTWRPSRAVAAIGTAVAVAGIAWAVLATGMDRLVAGALVVAAAAAVTYGLRRRVVAGPAGVTVRGILTTRRWLWADLDALAVATQQRLGLTSTTVELDLGDELVVLGRLDLDDDPHEVHRTLLRWYTG